MITLLDPAFWVAKLIADCPVFDGRIFETLENDNSILDYFDTPLALVYLSSDSSEPNQMVGMINQQHDYLMSVQIALRKTVDKTDRLHQADSRKLQACRLELLMALVGWVPDDCDKPIEHVAGELNIRDSLLLWTDRFTTNNYLRVY